MADATRIDWCDATINPWGWGCYGPGGTAEQPQVCWYCYARRLAHRGLRDCPDCQAFRPHWHAAELEKPLHWRRPRRIFVQSMGDPFGEWVTLEQLDRVLEVIAATPQHTYYMLTKQPQNIMRLLYQVTEAWPCRELGGGDYLPNLWLGVSITRHSDTLWPSDAWWPYRDGPDQRPWPQMFASVEPLLGPVGPECLEWANWIIGGALSGPVARTYTPQREWVERIIAYADQRNVPVFLKSSITALWPDLARQEWPR